jgi:crotonobetainyl-CoA:carnitine CoA-transferase CaiB-like acyl-CoA transferase
MQSWCDGKTLEQALRGLEAARIPAATVNSPQQVLDDPDIAATGYLHKMNYPGLPAAAPIIETPFRLSATPATLRSRAPQLGEHTDAILAELGYTTEAVAALRAAAVI